MTFVVVEGGEGSGKSTQVGLLALALAAQGHDVVATFEPGDTEVGAQIRDALLRGDSTLDARAELLLLLADRAQHVSDVIAPALARGAIVVSDRYSPSTLVYQGIGRGLGIDEVERLDSVTTSGIQPDLVIVLDVPDDVAEARVAAERDRFERAGAEFHARVRAAYRSLASARGWVLVDGSGSPAEVAARVQAAVAAALP